MIVRGVTGSLLVLAGGLVTTALPDSIARTIFAPFVIVGTSMPGRMVGLATTVAGLGLLAWAWLDLVRRTGATSADTPTRLAEVWRATMLWSLPLLVAPPLFSRDGWSYAALGEMTNRGRSPYVFGPIVLDGPLVERIDPLWLDTPSPYGPLPLLFGSWFAELSKDPWVLVLGHRLTAVAGLLLLAYAVPRLARAAGHDPALASALALASPLMLAHGIGGLHNDLLMVGLMAAGLAVALQRTPQAWITAAAIAGLAAAVKLPGGLACIGIALVTLPAGAATMARLRRFIGVGLTSVATLLGTGMVVGVGAGWVHGLAVPGIIRTPLSAPTVIGGFLDALLTGLGAPAAGDLALSGVRGLGTALALGVAAWLGLRAPTGHRGSAVRTTAIVMTATFLLSPVVHAWYSLWFVPFAACLWLGHRRMQALIAGCVVLGVTAPLDSSLRGAHVMTWVAILLVVAVAVPLLAHTATIRLRRLVGVRGTRPASAASVAGADPASPMPALHAGPAKPVQAG